jgi:uncharacterized protein (DUF362 family)
MSFLIDHVLLLFLGWGIYVVGKRQNWSLLAKIAIGTFIEFVFILFSISLYYNVFRCVFPTPFSPIKMCQDAAGKTISASEFMFHTNWQEQFLGKVYISSLNTPLYVVLLVFLVVYPILLIVGYSLGLWRDQKRKKPTISGKLLSWKELKKRDKPKPSNIEDYVIVRNPKPKDCVNKAIKKLGKKKTAEEAIKKFVKPKNKVVIKVNICGGLPERVGSFTNPEVVSEVVRLVRSAGAGEIIVGDADMVWTDFESAARKEGWYEWKDKINKDVSGPKKVKLVNFSTGPKKRLNFGDDTNDDLKDEIVSEHFVDADVIISIPAMKTHLFTEVTLGMKNMYGTFPEIDKAKYHKHHEPITKNKEMKKIGDIERVIIWMNRAFTPDLTIVDGTIGGEGVGPLSVDMVNFQTVVASADVVMADSIASRLMGFLPENIDHLRLAHNMEEMGKGDLMDLPLHSKELRDKSSEKNEKLVEWLQREYYSHPKDGNWVRPSPSFTNRIDSMNTLAASIPFLPMSFIMSLISDFFSYETARLPILGNISAVLLKVVNEVFLGFDKIFPKDEEKTESWVNLLLLTFILVIPSIFLFITEVYNQVYQIESVIYKSSDIYNLGFLSLIPVVYLFSWKIKTKELLALILSSLFVFAFVEKVAPSAEMWKYIPTNGYYFAVFAWPLLIIAILGFTFILQRIIHGLELFNPKTSNDWLTNSTPFLLILALFVLFTKLEGYTMVFDFNFFNVTQAPQLIVNIKVGLMYTVMAILGFLYARKQHLDWTLSLILVSLGLGIFMEILGSNHLFTYPLEPSLHPDMRFVARVPILIGFASVINVFAVHGIPRLFKIDMARSTALVRCDDCGALKSKYDLTKKGDTFLCDECKEKP